MYDPIIADDASAEVQARYRAFASRFVAPKAATADQQRQFCPELIEVLRAERFLGGPMSPEYGGAGLDMVSYGLLTGEIGRACSSTRTLLTVHNLVGLTLQRWGNSSVKGIIVPELAQGRAIAAIALSKSQAGSDIHAIQTRLSANGSGFRLNGQKTWVSFGSLADWFLVFARSDGGAVAVVVRADTAGLSLCPINSVTGMRGSMMAELTFNDCDIEPWQLVGRPGFGLSHIAADALDHGRYSVAWGAVGLAEACLIETAKYLSDRRQFNRRMINLPLARAHLARMITDCRAARQLCLSAGRLRASKNPHATLENSCRKVFFRPGGWTGCE